MANAKNTDAYLLGQIDAKVTALLENQEQIIEDVEKLKNQSWFVKGAVFVGSLLGGGIGAKIASAFDVVN